jgi:hypothetical protein
MLKVSQSSVMMGIASAARHHLFDHPPDSPEIPNALHFPKILD